MVGFFTAPSIAWGTGALEQLSGLGARRATVVVAPTVASLAPTRRAVEELERSEVSVTTIADVPLEPRTDRLPELAARLRATDPDWLVVVGGGTAIDAVKAARLLLERPELSLERPAIELAIEGPARTGLAAIPTTSGSGAEASWVADLIAPDESPIELAHRALVPTWALVEPAFAANLAPAAVARGALETAAQACEAYLSAWANPFSDALAIEALRTVTRRLPHALRWSDDPDARAALHYAATEAGLAQSNAQRGLAHAVARALVRPTGLDYATLLGIALPAVLEFDRPGARERLDALAEALRQPDDTSTVPVAERLARLIASSGAPPTLTAAGVSSETLATERARIVTDTLRSPAVLANPRVPSAEDVGRLVETLLAGPAKGTAARAV